MQDGKPATNRLGHASSHASRPRPREAVATPLVARLVLLLAGASLGLAPGSSAEAQALFHSLGVKAGPTWATAHADDWWYAHSRYADRGRSVFLDLESAPLWGAFSLAVELGYVLRSGPALHWVNATPGFAESPPDTTARYGFGSAASLVRFGLLDAPIRVYALAGPRVDFDLGGNSFGARDLLVELTGGIGAELPLAVPVFIEARGSLGLTDLSVTGEGIQTRALDLLMGVATIRQPAAGGAGFIRRIGLKSGVTWGAVASHPMELSADGLLLYPFWSGFLALETRNLAGPLAGVLELGFVQRGYGEDQGEADPPVQAHKHAALSAALLARVGVCGSRLGTAYALAGPRILYRESGWTDDVRAELTAGVGFALRRVPVFLEARANASLIGAASDPSPPWHWSDNHSYDRALDLFLGINLIGGDRAPEVRGPAEK